MRTVAGRVKRALSRSFGADGIEWADAGCRPARSGSSRTGGLVAYADTRRQAGRLCANLAMTTRPLPSDALRGGHRHRGPLPAADRVEDVLRLLAPPTTARRRTPTSARSASACPAPCRSINRRAVEHVLATGLAIEASIAGRDPLGPQELLLPGPAQGLPDQPVRPAARVARPADLRDVGRARSSVAITRAHLEEDTAKLVHGTDETGGKVSLVDFNRSGAPLMEIVTEPEIRTAEQARRYAEELQLLLRAIGASDADMERGQMRVEANVSLRPRGTEPFGTRVEVKNMNSFRSVERAIDYEIERQAATLDAGEHARPWRRAAGPTTAARRIACGPRRPPTTTATSRSRTCRRCTSTRPG